MILRHEQSFDVFYDYLVDNAVKVAEIAENSSPELSKAIQGPRLLFFFVKVELFRDETDTAAKNKMAKQLFEFLKRLDEDSSPFFQDEILLEESTKKIIQCALKNNSKLDPVPLNLYDAVQVFMSEKAKVKCLVDAFVFQQKVVARLEQYRAAFELSPKFNSLRKMVISQGHVHSKIKQSKLSELNSNCTEMHHTLNYNCYLRQETPHSHNFKLMWWWFLFVFLEMGNVATIEVQDHPIQAVDVDLYYICIFWLTTRQRRTALLIAHTALPLSSSLRSLPLYASTH